MRFTHLRVASSFSAHYGTAHPKTLVETVAGRRADAAAITDRDGLYGAIRHIGACRAAGVDPIVGVELGCRDDRAGAGAGAGGRAGAAGAGAPVDRIVVLAHGSLVGAPVDAAEPGLESEFVAQLNGVRANAGLPPLAVDGELTAVARAWTDQMAAAGGLPHNPSVGSQVSAPWRGIGENVGTGGSVGSVMQAFVQSEGHYLNIIDGDYDHFPEQAFFLCGGIEDLKANAKELGVS